MAIDASFWVAISFIIFLGALIYLKIQLYRGICLNFHRLYDINLIDLTNFDDRNKNCFKYSILEIHYSRTQYKLSIRHLKIWLYAIVQLFKYI